MNINGNFKSSLSSKLEFRLKYCRLPVPVRRENFTDLHNLSNANFSFLILILKQHYLSVILPVSSNLS